MAKTYNCRPSDYFEGEEIGTWEKFCIDEAVAYFMATEEAEKAQKDKPTKPADVAKPKPSDNILDVMNHDFFKKK